MTTVANSHLSAAKSAKNDEFYTQWADIEREMNAYLEYNPDVFRDKVVLLPCDDPEWSNFAKFFALHFMEYGIKKLISTSYAPDSNPAGAFHEPTDFELDDPKFDPKRTRVNGKKFTLEPKDINDDGIVNIDDLQWEYLESDGDFRSPEVTALRDEADIVITNPPFSLFRDFTAWVVAADKKFSVIANSNATTYREIFPLIKANRMWKGATANATDMVFGVPKGAPVKDSDRLKAEKLGYPPNDEYDYTRLGNSCWFTNLDHGRRHQPLQLMSTEDNIKFSRHKEVRSVGYRKYDNYDAIEVPFIDAIPSDYDGVMGVPITFLDKHDPDQFEILGATQRGCHADVPDFKKYNDYREMRQDGTPTGSSGNKTNENANIAGNDGKKNYFINDEGHVIQSAYQRIFIRRKDAS
ncbi:DNA methyltransferase [Kocuria sp. WN036]|uniref:adenine-specific methyltransferase EcoRI family protein n=1 Tax=Kocuria sp. WN036 TaxID=2032628 RepID=UPI000BABDDFD|nr:adenine-specific methyltransferase EcoRI family protein [Kocuria sp. WN036]PAU89211.1 DNA methyltransferase [Kocuria sp. WN036]